MKDLIRVFFLQDLGMFLAGSFILICGYLGNISVTAVLTLTLALGFMGLTTAGYSVNLLDIAPQLAGALMGISNSLAPSQG